MLQWPGIMLHKSENINNGRNTHTSIYETYHRQLQKISSSFLIPRLNNLQLEKIYSPNPFNNLIYHISKFITSLYLYLSEP